MSGPLCRDLWRRESTTMVPCHCLFTTRVLIRTVQCLEAVCYLAPSAGAIMWASVKGSRGMGRLMKMRHFDIFGMCSKSYSCKFWCSNLCVYALCCMRNLLGLFSVFSYFTAPLFMILFHHDIPSLQYIHAHVNCHFSL